MTHPVADQAGVRLYCKRDDLYGWDPHSPLQGNKVRKLAYWLNLGLEGRTVVSFGGAYSNHLAALADAGRKFGFLARCFVRGEQVDNPTLDYITRQGAILRFISRSDYRRKTEAGFQDELGLGEELFIPEGGTAPAVLASVGAVYSETIDQLGRAPDYFCLSAGTGGTAAGVIASAVGTATRIEVFPALKGNWMAGEIRGLLPPSARNRSFDVITGYTYGGYAKFPRNWKLSTSDGWIAKRADIGEPGLPPLEPVYTAKLFSGVLDRLKLACYSPGTDLVILHSGGIY